MAKQEIGMFKRQLLNCLVFFLNLSFAIFLLIIITRIIPSYLSGLWGIIFCIICLSAIWLHVAFEYWADRNYEVMHYHGYIYKVNLKAVKIIALMLSCFLVALLFIAFIALFKQVL